MTLKEKLKKVKDFIIGTDNYVEDEEYMDPEILSDTEYSIFLQPIFHGLEIYRHHLNMSWNNFTKDIEKEESLQRVSLKALRIWMRDYWHIVEWERVRLDY